MAINHNMHMITAINFGTHPFQFLNYQDPLCFDLKSSQILCFPAIHSFVQTKILVKLEKKSYFIKNTTTSDTICIQITLVALRGSDVLAISNSLPDELPESESVSNTIALVIRMSQTRITNSNINNSFSSH